MNSQKRFWPIAVTVVAAVGSFLLSRVIWPDLASMVPPSAGQMPFFIGVGVFESLAFGIGVSFIIFGWKMVQGRGTGAWLAFLSVAWGLVSWWPHDNLHRVTPEGDYANLLKLEWGFHVTLMIAAVLIGSFLWKSWSNRVQSGM